MTFISYLGVAASLVSAVYSHAVIINAQGIAGSPASVGFGVIPGLNRKCTNISPCQQDATLIRDQEIIGNVANECGRTELLGNLDVGENTENALAINAVTQVKSGSQIVVTIHQVNADGGGPFGCDMDQTSNGLGVSGQIPLDIVGPNVPGSNGLNQEKEIDHNITIQMPANFTCIGGSTGNICTVRCRNVAQAGPFGSCIAVQQVDVTPHVNTAKNIAAFKSLNDVLAQVDTNVKNFPAAVKAIDNAGSAESEQAVSVANAIVGGAGLPNFNPVKGPAQQVAGQQLASAATNDSTTPSTATPPPPPAENQPAAPVATPAAAPPAAAPSKAPSPPKQGGNTGGKPPGQGGQNGQNGQNRGQGQASGQGAKGQNPKTGQNGQQNAKTKPQNAQNKPQGPQPNQPGN